MIKWLIEVLHLCQIGTWDSSKQVQITSGLRKNKVGQFSTWGNIHGRHLRVVTVEVMSRNAFLISKWFDNFILYIQGILSFSRYICKSFSTFIIALICIILYYKRTPFLLRVNYLPNNHQHWKFIAKRTFLCVDLLLFNWSVGSDCKE